MQKITEFVANRQAKGHATTLYLVAKRFDLSVKEVVDLLIEEALTNQMILTYWPKLTATGHVYIVPNEDNLKTLDLTLEEVLWPPLESDLFATDMPARMYVHNHFLGMDKAETGWGNNMKDLYRELALKHFGPSADWTAEHGLRDELVVPAEVETAKEGKTAKAPKEPKAPKAPKTPKAPKEKKERKPAKEKGTNLGLGRCRLCGKTLTAMDSLSRGFGSFCFQQLANHSGISLEELRDAQQITDDQIDAIVGDINSKRPTLTLEEAQAAYPQGFISVTDLVELAKSHNVTVSMLLVAMGGNRGTGPKHSPFWEIFFIRNTRYFDRRVLEELDQLPKKEGRHARIKV